MLNIEAEKAILTRLKTVKGHIAGIVQISAARSAIEKIGIYLLENNAKDCLCSEIKSVEEKERIQKTVKQIISFLK